MSRDNDIFFNTETFPHKEWMDLLALYDAVERPIDDLDRKHLITHKWWIPTADNSGVHLDLKKLNPDRHIYPKGYRWRIGIHASTGTLSEWFLYAIPIIACVRFTDTIFWDPHPPIGFVTCDVDGIVQRAETVVPTRCKVKLLSRYGYTDGKTMWPTALSDRSVSVPAEMTQQVALAYCKELEADFFRSSGVAK